MVRLARIGHHHRQRRTGVRAELAGSVRMAVVELTSEPRVDYLRAAIGMLARRRPAELPDVELVRRGMRTDRAHLTAYESVCGFRVTDVLPATYPHLLAFPLAMRLMSGADFPFPVVGLVDG